MNRRNFLIGIGTAATLSGGASVTGAALNNTVSTGFSGFKVVANQQIVVRRNEALTEQNVLTNNENFSSDEINFSKVGQDSPVEYADFPQLYVNNKTDGNIILELATGDQTTSQYNTNLSSGGTEPYNGSESYGYAPLEIENTGSEQKEVAMKYGYGSDVTDPATNLTKGQVAELYRFHIGTTQISPFKNTPDTEGNTVTFDPGQARRVNLNIQLFESTAEDIRSAAGSVGSYSFNQDGRARADLLDTAVFGDMG